MQFPRGVCRHIALLAVFINHVHWLFNLTLGHKQHPSVLALSVQLHACVGVGQTEQVRQGEHGGAYQIITTGDIFIINIYLEEQICPDDIMQ